MRLVFDQLVAFWPAFRKQEKASHKNPGVSVTEMTWRPNQQDIGVRKEQNVVSHVLTTVKWRCPIPYTCMPSKKTVVYCVGHAGYLDHHTPVVPTPKAKIIWCDSGRPSLPTTTNLWNCGSDGLSDLISMSYGEFFVILFQP